MYVYSVRESLSDRLDKNRVVRTKILTHRKVSSVKNLGEA